MTAPRNISVGSAFPLRRDQPRLGHFVRWGDQLIVNGEKPLVVEAATGTVSALSVSGCDKLESATAAGLLCRNHQGKLQLLREDEIESFPEPIASANYLSVAADDQTLVAYSEGKLAIKKDEWRVHDIGKAPESEGTMGLPTHALVAGDRVLFGYDRGEWGGGLFSVSLSQPSWQRIEHEGPLPLPVKQLRLGPEGKPWVVWGLAHLGLREGTVATIRGSALDIVVDSSTWKLGKADFDALEFAPDGSPLLLSGALGVLARKDGTWRPIIDGWSSEHDYTYVSGLALVDDLLVIATYDAGLLIAERDGGSLRRL